MGEPVGGLSTAHAAMGRECAERLRENLNRFLKGLVDKFFFGWQVKCFGSESMPRLETYPRWAAYVPAMI